MYKNSISAQCAMPTAHCPTSEKKLLRHHLSNQKVIGSNPSQCSVFPPKWFKKISPNKPHLITPLIRIPKPLLKIWTANSICWNSLGLFRDYGLNYIFLKNKIFVFQDRKMKYTASFKKKNFVKPCKISTKSDNGQKKWK